MEASQLYGEMVESAASRARELMDLGATGRDLVIGTLAAALCADYNQRGKIHKYSNLEYPCDRCL